MTTLYSSADAGDILGVTTARIRQLCKELGIQRQGRDWLLTDADLERIRARQANPLKGGWPKGKSRKPNAAAPSATAPDARTPTA